MSVKKEQLSLKFSLFYYEKNKLKSLYLCFLSFILSKKWFAPLLANLRTN